MTPAGEAALAGATREQLFKIVRIVSGHPTPATSYAKNDALRSAIQFYLKNKRLTEANIFAAIKGEPA